MNGESTKRLDLSRQQLKKLPRDLDNVESYTECFLDDNEFSKLEGLDALRRLRKLSARRNRLVKIVGLSRLSELVELDLSENTIQSVENLKSLRLLQKLNLSGNDIKSYGLLSSNHNLRYLDLSNNGISNLSDISGLTELQTLNLSRNIISSLSTAKKDLPTSIVSFDLSDNEIDDLCSISCLHFLTELEYLVFSGNRCVTNLECDYRPFIVNWCYKVKILDGKPISQHERLVAEWLFSQGQGRRFNLGEHNQLIEYLTRICPLNYNNQRNGAINLVGVREAWTNGELKTAPIVNPVSKPREMSNDMVMEDVVHFRESVESTNKLQSESVFLPCSQSHESEHGQELEDKKIIESVQKRLSTDAASRPLTAPSGSRKPVVVSREDVSVNPPSDNKSVGSSISDHHLHNDSPLRQHSDRPKTSPASASSVNKYEEYESRPCRPMSKQLMKELFDDETGQRQQQQQQQTAVHKASRPLVNGRPSTSSSALTAAVDRPQRNADAKKPLEHVAVVPPHRLRVRRSRVGNVSTNESVSKIVETEVKSSTQSHTNPTTPEIPRRNDQRQAAALKIQAWWRGHADRKRVQPLLRRLAFQRYGKMISTLMEMRKADTDHIRRLEETLVERDRQDRKARRLQTAAIKQLWEQVQSMKQQLAILTGASDPTKTVVSLPPSLPVLQSQVSDENLQSVTNDGPHSSTVTDSVRSLPGGSSPEPTSPSRRNQNIDFVITRRSPYAIRNSKKVNGTSPTTPTKPINGDDIGKAAQMSPLATPPRSRQSHGSIATNGNGTNGEIRRMAAKFSYLPENVNGGEVVRFNGNFDDELSTSEKSSSLTN